MEPIDIGIYVSAGMLVMVFLGMRVAFAAGLAGFIGLVWLRWNQFDYDPDRLWKAVEISVKIAGQVPHSKVSAQALSLIPTFILIGYMAYYANLTKALFEAAKKWIAWVPGGLAVSTVFATAAPKSRRTRWSPMSMPAALPADVMTCPSSTYSTEPCTTEPPSHASRQRPPARGRAAGVHSR